MQIKQVLAVLTMFSAATTAVTAYGPRPKSAPLKRELYLGPHYHEHEPYSWRDRGFYQQRQYRPEEQRRALSFGGRPSYLKIGNHRLDFASVPAALSFENIRLLATADPITIPAISSVAGEPGNHANAVPAVSTMSDIPVSDTREPKSAVSTSRVTTVMSGSIKVNELNNAASMAPCQVAPTIPPALATSKLTLALRDGSTRLTSSSVSQAVPETSTVAFNEKIKSTATPLLLTPPEPNYAVLDEKNVLQQPKHAPQNHNPNQFVLAESKYHPETNNRFTFAESGKQQDELLKAGYFTIPQTKYSLQNQNQNHFTLTETQYHPESINGLVSSEINKNQAQPTIVLPGTMYIQPSQNANQNQFDKVNYLASQDLKTHLIQQLPQSFNYLSSLPISIQPKFPQADFSVPAASAISGSVGTVNYVAPSWPSMTLTTGDSTSVSLPLAGRIPSFGFDKSFAHVAESGQTKNLPFSSGLQLNLGGFGGIDYSSHQLGPSNPSGISGPRPMALGIAKVGLGLPEPPRPPSPSIY